MACGKCKGEGQVPVYKPMSFYDCDPDSDYVKLIGWNICDFCKGDGMSPAERIKNESKMG
jgi:hypothetical protein